VPARDRIVPPESAEVLVTALPQAERMAPPLGHIGMIVGGRAKEQLWQPLSEWLQRLNGGEARSRARPKARRRRARS